MEIYNVLIVDDEPAIVDSLKQLLEEKAAYTLEVFCAYSGAGALKLMQSHRIDIMFCDIRMPGISGLQLVELVRMQWPICRILMLTAHVDFEYSRKALQLGVSDYILKSDKDERILEGLHQCIRQFDQEIAKFQWLRADNAQTDKKLKVLQRHALLDILVEKSSASSSGRILEALDYLPEQGGFYLVLATVNQHGEHPQDVIVQATESFFSSTDLLRHSAPFAHGALWLMQAASVNQSADFESRLNGLLELVAQYLQSSHQIVCHFVMSHRIDQAEALAKEVTLLKRKAESLSSYSQFIICQMQTSDYETDNSRDRTIERIRQFIEDHIGDDLSLTTISKSVGYNASYLSRLYLASTKQTIRDYIAERKLYHIQELMKQPELSLGAISRMLGFESQSHFNRFIKRFTDKTPGELRDAIARAQ